MQILLIINFILDTSIYDSFPCCSLLQNTDARPLQSCRGLALSCFDGLFAKMYEDWSAGRITEYNFNMLSEKYQNEQKELETKIRQLHETMEAAVQTAADAEKWIALMKQYVNPVWS